MSGSKLRIALAQINTVVGDFGGNEKRILDALKRATQLGVDLVAFPELTVTGYPPEDLLLRHSFVERSERLVRALAPQVKGVTAVVGFPERRNGKLYNAAAILCDGEVATTYQKIHLPNYGVFDEKRYFESGDEPLVLQIRGVNVGINICEDLWFPDVAAVQALKGDAELILNISASPYHAGKRKVRQELVAGRARDNWAWVAMVNLVGGQDELVFDGNSAVADYQGRLVTAGKAFEEDLIVFDVDATAVQKSRRLDPHFASLSEGYDSPMSLRVVKLPLGETATDRPDLTPRRPEDIAPGELEEIYKALVLGVHDYVVKNGFTKVVLGLSGGIDSALTAAVATDALGPENVMGLTMPSQFSSTGSVADSQALARNLGIRLEQIPIREIFDQYLAALAPHFQGLEPDITEENLQARIRGNLLMAFANKFNWIVLSTGNKSELSVGYCTIYGDMVGGFAVLKDVPKTLVYKLARYRNEKAGYDLIPESILTKPPSAELRPNQTDQDTLPPYEVLDPIIEAYVERDLSFQEIVQLGFDPAVVRDVIRRIDLAEYKRRQAPPGVKITPRAFGKDRRMPITNRYREA